MSIDSFVLSSFARLSYSRSDTSLRPKISSFIKEFRLDTTYNAPNLYFYSFFTFCHCR